MIRRVLALLPAFLLTHTLHGQTPQGVTPEWMLGLECARITATPEMMWLDDGSLLLRDPLSRDGGIVMLDPSSGERTAVLDARTAMMRLGAALGANVRRLPTPDAWEDSGQRVLYALAGDLYTLELANARVTRLTKTKAVEHNARFSPDGTKVAFTREGDLWVHDLESGSELRLTHDGSDTILNGTLSWVYWEEIFGRQDIGYWWSDDGRSIAFLRSDDSMVTKMTYVDFLPETPRVIHQRYPKAGTANPVVRVGVVSVEKEPETVWIDVPDQAYEYVCRVQWLPDNERLSVQTMDRSQKQLDLWIAQASSGKAQRILRETDPAWVNIHDDLYFLKDGKHFLWVSERSGFAHLYRYTLDGKLVNQVTKGAWALRSANPIFWLRKAVQAIDEKTGTVYFTSLEAGSVQKQLYSIKLDGSGKRRITKASGTWNILFSKDASRFVGIHSDARTPPSVAVYGADDKRVTRIMDPRTDIAAAKKPALPELFTIPARDGFKLPAMVFKPEGFDAGKKHPVIVHVYGGPSAPSVGDAWQGWMWFNTMLAAKGYIVVDIDNRSATAISKKLENTILGQMSGDHELNDLVDGVQWLKKQPWVDPERVGIWGWSNGGMLTLLLMTRSAEFKAGVSVAPVTRWNYYDTKWGETVNKLPAENQAGYSLTDLTKRAKDLHGRLLLVHGTYDDNVHIQNSWHFVDEMIKAGKIFELMIYPMRQHGIADRPARLHLYKTMLEFWERSL